jgi:glycosyltransferase involved in cell wall biosynthesis
MQAPGAGNRIVLIRGSGVDTSHFTALPDPPERPVEVGFVGRMLSDKGVQVLIEAYRRLLARGVPLRLVLAGLPDPENPTSIPEAEIQGWLALPGLTWLRQVSDVREVWARAHIAVLPSFHERLPKSLLEAAACARPIVATDIPGCREVAIADLNALIVPVGDAAALAHAIERLARDDGLRQRFGAARVGVAPDLSTPISVPRPLLSIAGSWLRTLNSAPGTMRRCGR